ncbi:MAG: hypothetical protein RL141_1037 [Candidatus Parcubacteria bacterium]|jgi:hypothetical protein
MIRCMSHVEILQDPLRLQALAATRAGLLTACMKGLFQAAGLAHPETGDEVKRAFEFKTDDAPSLILSVLRHASQLAIAHCESYQEISFSLITDKQAIGVFIGRPLLPASAGAAATCPPIPSVLGIDGEIAKGEDGLWRATIALGASA